MKNGRHEKAPSAPTLEADEAERQSTRKNVMDKHTEVTGKLNASTSKVPVTVESTFTICNVEQQELFAVRPGIPAVDALVEASCILSELKGQLEFMAMGRDAIPSSNAWSLFRAVNSAKAVIDSVQEGLEKAR
ncbi:DUF3077 domain-containing protein [Pseudomonas chlororaphis]|uniref:DUF3077 domain-containing protein n=1 Tax=Pseudomonas chlororaphis TaxID=587753 RepID=UPI0004969E9E|nr:DUF3077 domain-containing protein [Pseudomonas chlororaphis]QLL15469.1 DUF3077 domain-containing protein [Pseudomonas chlororaphis subsp. aurantiaca]